MSRRKGVELSNAGSKKVFLSDSFQELINIKLFGLNFCIVHNDVLCVASLAADNENLRGT